MILVLPFRWEGYTLFLLYGLGFGAYLPTANALVGDRVPASHRARGFAVFMLVKGVNSMQKAEEEANLNSEEESTMTVG